MEMRAVAIRAKVLEAIMSGAAMLMCE